jgi:hypothetical protein
MSSPLEQKCEYSFQLRGWCGVWTAASRMRHLFFVAVAVVVRREILFFSMSSDVPYFLPKLEKNSISFGHD